MIIKFNRVLCILLSACLLTLGGCTKEGIQEPNSLSYEEQYELGVRYLSEGSYQEAILAFTAAIEIDPKQALAYVGRGGAYIGSGETEETLTAAQADYEQAVGLDEMNVNAYLGLADAYIRQGKFDEARAVLETGLKKTGAQDISDKLAEFESGNIKDAYGRNRKTTFYDGEGNLLSYAVYQYPNGVTDISTYDPSGNQIAHGRSVLDKKGNQIEYYNTTYTGELMKNISKYDENGNQIFYEQFGTDGAQIQRREMIYNEQNQVIRETYYDSYGGFDRPKYTWAYTYDAAGNQIEQIECGMDGTPLYVSEKYRYDSNGNKIEELYYGYGGDLVGKRVYEYDDHGNQTSCTYWTSDGDVYYDTSSYVYDDRGNAIGGTNEFFYNGELQYSSEW